MVSCGFPDSGMFPWLCELNPNQSVAFPHVLKHKVRSGSHMFRGFNPLELTGVDVTGTQPLHSKKLTV